MPFGDRPSTRFFGRTSGDDLVLTDTSGARVASTGKPSSSDVWGCDGTPHQEWTRRWHLTVIVETR